MKKKYLCALLAISCVACCATTIDGITNCKETPELPLDIAYAIARKHLKVDSSLYQCVIASSIRKSSGGGWMLFFQAPFKKKNLIRIDARKNVSIKENANFNTFKNVPTPELSLDKIIQRIKKITMRPIVFANWDPKEKEWNVDTVDERHPGKRVSFYIGKKTTKTTFYEENGEMIEEAIDESESDLTRPK